MMIRYFILFFISFSCPFIQASGCFNYKQRSQCILDRQREINAERTEVLKELNSSSLSQDLRASLSCRFNKLSDYQFVMQSCSKLCEQEKKLRTPSAVYMEKLLEGAALREELAQMKENCNQLRSQAQQSLCLPVNMQQVRGRQQSILLGSQYNNQNEGKVNPAQAAAYVHGRFQQSKQI